MATERGRSAVRVRAVAALLLGSVALAGALAGSTAGVDTAPGTGTAPGSAAGAAPGAAPGTDAAAGAKTVGTAGGPPGVVVPDVLGLPALKAGYRIDFAHLVPVCREAHRRGTVVEQRPAAGTDVARGSTVTIVSGDDDCAAVNLIPTAPSASTTTTVPSTATTTGRATVQPGLDPIPPGAALHTITVAFDNFTLGYVLVSATAGTGCEIAVEKTTDGGADLGKAVPVAPCSQLTQGTTVLVRMAVDGSGDGFVYGKVLYATHDGGRTWQEVPEPGQVRDVEAVGSSVWMFVGRCTTPSCSPDLMESTDGGRSWHPSPVEPPMLATTTDPQLVRVSAVSAYVLTAPRRNAFGEPDTVPMWSTVDGGRSWAPRAISCPVDAFGVAMAASPGGTLLAVCAAQPAAGSQPKSVVTSSDGGATWSPAGPCTTAILKDSCVARSLMFGYLGTLVSASPTVAYLTGTRGPIYETTDGGATWARVGGVPATGNAFLAFFGEEDGMALSGVFTPALWRTDDGGATWNKVALHRAS